MQKSTASHSTALKIYILGCGDAFLWPRATLYLSFYRNLLLIIAVSTCAPHNIKRDTQILPEKKWCALFYQLAERNYIASAT